MSEPNNPSAKSSRHKRRQARHGVADAVVTMAAGAEANEGASGAPVVAPRFARATEPVPDAVAGAEVGAAAVGTHGSPTPANEAAPALDAPAAREEFAAWLRAARQAKGMSLEQMAQRTRIQARVLACLEAGQFDALHADVFVRGYLRSYAQCVGLDAGTVLERYSACGLVPCPVAAPDAGRIGSIVSAATTVRFGAPPQAAREITLVAAEPATTSPSQIATAASENAPPVAPASALAGDVRAVIARAESAPPAHQAPVIPKMPKPHLVIDDANPELAEREAASRPQAERDWTEGGFSSPFLRGEREPKQTGLTLAVIVLLVAATIALSYLMRTTPTTRGVTATPAQLHRIG